MSAWEPWTFTHSSGCEAVLALASGLALVLALVPELVLVLGLGVGVTTM
jgi:hypothetical protein